MDDNYWKNFDDASNYTHIILQRIILKLYEQKNDMLVILFSLRLFILVTISKLNSVIHVGDNLRYFILNIT